MGKMRITRKGKWLWLYQK